MSKGQDSKKELKKSLPKHRKRKKPTKKLKKPKKAVKNLAVKSGVSGTT